LLLAMFVRDIVVHMLIIFAGDEGCYSCVRLNFALFLMVAAQQECKNIDRILAPLKRGFGGFRSKNEAQPTCVYRVAY
jgi:hypothetical protein